MRRILLLGTVVLAALAAARAEDRAAIPGFFDLAVTGGEGTYEAMGFAPEERGTALSLLARQRFSQGTGSADRAGRRMTALLAEAGATSPQARKFSSPAPQDPGPFFIAAPLSAEAWRDVLAIPAHADLFATLVSNRPAMLVCAGAMATDLSVRALLDKDRGLLRAIVRTAPGAFVVAADSLHIADDRIVVPGGAGAEPLWEALVVERVTRPAAFIRALMLKDGGRLAWFYHTMGSMSAERVAALMPPGPTSERLVTARSLYESFREAEPNWHLEDHPYLRATADPWLVASQVAVRDGLVGPPSWRWLWGALFERPDIPRRDAAAIPRGTTPASFAWLARQIAGELPRERRDRYEMVRFGQAVFAGARETDAPDILVALGGYRRFRSVLLALDRMEVRDAFTMARVVDAARRIDERPGREQRPALVAMQAALAIVERARVMKAIDAETAGRLVRSLADATDRDTPMPRAVAQWIDGPLVDALPRLIQPDQESRQTAHESRILQAMAGPAEEDVPHIVWEGLAYDVDLAAAERERIARIREQLDAPALGTAIASGKPEPLADALLALVYAPALGDPEGPALLSHDVAARHDFKTEGPAGSRRDVLPWLPPRDQLGDGMPWHVAGALLGLDLGLARLALRRIADNEMPVAPSINLNDELTLARTALAINPRDLQDRDRDRIVEAIARGRARVAAANHSLSAVRALAEEAQVSHAVRETLPWLVTRAPDTVPALFGLLDFVWLGHPELDHDTLDHWGSYSEPIDGRLRTAMPAAHPWDSFGGRADGGVMGALSPDLTLRMAVETARLKLPARLVPALLLFATEEYWHDVSARFSDDRPAMARQALALSPSRVEDYVAALAGNGPLRLRVK